MLRVGDDTTAGSTRPESGRVVLPRSSGGSLGVRRVVLGFLVALTGVPLLSAVLLALRGDETLTSSVLAYQLLVVIVALIGGIWPALVAAVVSGLTLDYLFIPPYGTVTIADPALGLSLALYVVIAALVSSVVDLAARRARAAQRAAAETELLASVSSSVVHGDDAAAALVESTRAALGMSAVRLIAADGAVIASDGLPADGDRAAHVPVGGPPLAVLELSGGPLDPSARRLLEAITAQLAAALERRTLTATAREADALAAADGVRSALLSAVSHDVRRPLAAAVAAVGGLRSTGDALAPADRAELLDTATESLATLSRLVTDLLDVSRVEAGVLAVSLVSVDAAGAVLGALDELGLGPVEVELALDPLLPPVSADPVLLQRVLVNLLANAVRHSPPDRRVLVSTGSSAGTAEIRIADHGAGVAPDRQEAIFAPFQRLGDTDNGTGLGLGLALSRGFATGMGGSLVAEDTPGGGLTQVLSLPLATARATHESLVAPDPPAEASA